MNWDAIGAAGEIIGALAVVLSLVYLASQIRVSNLAAKQAAMHEVQNLSAQFTGQIASNLDNARIWAKGGMDDDDLTDYERIQYRAMLTQLNSAWERIYRAHMSGELDSWYFEYTLKSMRRIIASKGYRAWFQDMKQIISDELREFLEEESARTTEEFIPQGIVAEKEK